MAKEKIERKIAVIFATDVVGYSKHMEADESETIHNLRECEVILSPAYSKSMKVVCLIQVETLSWQSFQVQSQLWNVQ